MLYALASSRETARSSQPAFVLSHRKILRMKMTIKGTGTKLPRMQTRMVGRRGRPSPTPMGIAPRSSMTGIMEARNTKMYFPTRVPVSQLNIGVPPGLISRG